MARARGSSCLRILSAPWCSLFFFFNDTATTEIYTLSLHDALPIWDPRPRVRSRRWPRRGRWTWRPPPSPSDRKSTRLNSSHDQISYAVFCLKKKKKRNGCSPAHSAAPTTLLPPPLACDLPRVSHHL